MDLTSMTPDATSLRALAHPLRLRILGLLRVDGPATASTLARQLELNTGATSYHLRQLAKHGFVVEDAERGNARDRWWRAAHGSTYFREDHADGADHVDAVDSFLQAVAVVHNERLQRHIEERSSLAEEWSRTSSISDWQILLTPVRAAALRDAIQSVVEGWDEEAEGTTGAEMYEVVLHAFPRPGRLTSDR